MSRDSQRRFTEARCLATESFTSLSNPWRSNGQRCQQKTGASPLLRLCAVETFQSSPAVAT